MATNTKEYSNRLATVARSIIKRNNIDITQGGRLLPIAKEMVSETGCNIDTAKRHLARQMRLMRGELLAPWGGKREGANGFPAGTKRQGQRGKAVENV